MSSRMTERLIRGPCLAFVRTSSKPKTTGSGHATASFSNSALSLTASTTSKVLDGRTVQPNLCKLRLGSADLLSHYRNLGRQRLDTTRGHLASPKCQVIFRTSNSTPAGPVRGPVLHLTIIPFLRWDEKAGLRRDAIRSQWSTRSKRNRKETGYEKD